MVDKVFELVELDRELERKEERLRNLKKAFAVATRQYKEEHTSLVKEGNRIERVYKELDLERKEWIVYKEVGYIANVENETPLGAKVEPEYIPVEVKEERVSATEDEVQEALKKHGEYFRLKKEIEELERWIKEAEVKRKELLYHKRSLAYALFLGSDKNIPEAYSYLKLAEESGFTDKIMGLLYNEFLEKLYDEYAGRGVPSFEEVLERFKALLEKVKEQRRKEAEERRKREVKIAREFFSLAKEYDLKVEEGEDEREFYVVAGDRRERFSGFLLDGWTEEKFRKRMETLVQYDKAYRFFSSRGWKTELWMDYIEVSSEKAGERYRFENFDEFLERLKVKAQEIKEGKRPVIVEKKKGKPLYQVFVEGDTVRVPENWKGFLIGKDGEYIRLLSEIVGVPLRIEELPERKQEGRLVRTVEKVLGVVAGDVKVNAIQRRQGPKR